MGRRCIIVLDQRLSGKFVRQYYSAFADDLYFFSKRRVELQSFTKFIFRLVAATINICMIKRADPQVKTPLNQVHISTGIQSSPPTTPSHTTCDDGGGGKTINGHLIVIKKKSRINRDFIDMSFGLIISETISAISAGTESTATALSSATIGTSAESTTTTLATSTLTIIGTSLVYNEFTAHHL